MDLHGECSNSARGSNRIRRLMRAELDRGYIFLYLFYLTKSVCKVFPHPDLLNCCLLPGLAGKKVMSDTNASWAPWLRACLHVKLNTKILQYHRIGCWIMYHKKFFKIILDFKLNLPYKSAWSLKLYQNVDERFWSKFLKCTEICRRYWNVLKWTKNDKTY